MYCWLDSENVCIFPISMLFSQAPLIIPSVESAGVMKWSLPVSRCNLCRHQPHWASWHLHCGVIRPHGSGYGGEEGGEITQDGGVGGTFT